MPAHGHIRSWTFQQNDAANLGETTSPSLSVIEVGTVANNKIVITYNELLYTGSVPATSDASLAGTTASISSVAVAGATVTWTLDRDIYDFETITLTYTAGANPIRDLYLNNAANLVNQAVTNNSDPFGAQYLEYPNYLITTPASIVYTDGTTSVRKRIVGTVYEIDITLTETGFDGAEDTDWVWILKHTGQTAVFRSGVRDGEFVVDGTITGTGFAGAEDTDWENLDTATGAGVLTTFRDGVRDEAYVIDKALSATGFAGAEDVDWENVRFGGGLSKDTRKLEDSTTRKLEDGTTRKKE